MSAQSNPITPSLVSGITPEAQITLLNVVVSEQEINLLAAGTIIHTLCERLTAQQRKIDALTGYYEASVRLESIARSQGG